MADKRASSSQRSKETFPSRWSCSKLRKRSAAAIQAPQTLQPELSEIIVKNRDQGDLKVFEWQYYARIGRTIHHALHEAKGKYDPDVWNTRPLLLRSISLDTHLSVRETMAPPTKFPIRLHNTSTVVMHRNGDCGQPAKA